MNSQSETPEQQLDNLAFDLVRLRHRPLLVLYYHEFEGEMREDNVSHICAEFRRAGLSREHTLDKLDVLIHTIGGDPHAGYRIAQAIRDHSQHVVFLVPEYSYSAGTLTCMCGNEIRLGDCAVLSPIDISVVSERTSERIELMSIDYYLEFATDCRRQIEIMLQQIRSSSSTNVENELLVEMVRQVRALNIGRFWRARRLTGYYAEILLTDYMFPHLPNKENLKDQIIRALLYTYPTHDFRMDFHICKKVGFPVSEMSIDESDKAKKLVDKLRILAHQGIICRDIGDTYKAPFIRLYMEGEM